MPVIAPGVELPPLATAADLDARGITPASDAQAVALLAAASAAVREAAGYVISRTPSTVTLPAPDGQWLPLPGAVLSVESVSINGVAEPDFTLVDGMLWRHWGWRRHVSWQSYRGALPRVTVTYTHGYEPVPADIVDLVCALVGSAVAAAEGGYQATAGLQSRTRQIDDYRETDTYETGSAGVVGRMEIPKPTRDWLRNRFFGGVSTTGVR